VAQIWSAVRKQNQSGSFSSATQLLVRDALSRGFAAVAIQGPAPVASVTPLPGLGLSCDSESSSQE
jgi:hypothetical protein